MIRDVTERNRAERRIQRLNRLYAVLSATNALIVRAPDRESLFTEACRIAVGKGGFPLAWIGLVQESHLVTPVAAWEGAMPAYRADLEARLGQGRVVLPEVDGVLGSIKPLIINDIATDPRMRAKDAALAAGLQSMVVLPLSVGGTVVALLTLGSDQKDTFDDDEMALLLDLANDLTFALEHLQQAERLDYLAYYDALTGLANRTLLLDRLAQHLRAAAAEHRSALVLLDLERFKNVNDTIGPAAADELLQQVATWLAGTSGDNSRVARVGADQFALMLPEFVHDAEVAHFLERTIEGFLRHPFRINGTDYRFAAKFGVAVCPDDGEDAATLFKHAEAALKKAKEGGERFLFYTQQMTGAMAGRLALESRLRQASENEEFVLHYQPKVHLRTDEITGVEALIRWNDPKVGLVPPGEFIRVLEDTGLIDDVGRWALRQAVADHQRWRAAGHAAPRIAVNVSPRQLRDRGFIADVERAVGSYEGAAAGLELEITEGMLMSDIAHNASSLHALRALGISVAIDDFGTGFSSLGYLSRLPVDTLKIDRSFIEDMQVSPKGLALVSTMVNLAHALELRIVAEGVETEDQARLLRLLGCDEMQGYLFSRPLPRDLLEQRFLGRAG
jgi:diguanylate cyclase (GGDEF)-like protein